MNKDQASKIQYAFFLYAKSKDETLIAHYSLQKLKEVRTFAASPDFQQPWFLAMQKRIYDLEGGEVTPALPPKRLETQPKQRMNIWHNLIAIILLILTIIFFIKVFSSPIDEELLFSPETFYATGQVETEIEPAAKGLLEEAGVIDEDRIDRLDERLDLLKQRSKDNAVRREMWRGP
ncbi:hypothetical protein ACFL1E_00780 [Candidatus Omnitrophota bacterium]